MSIWRNLKILGRIQTLSTLQSRWKWAQVMHLFSYNIRGRCLSINMMKLALYLPLILLNPSSNKQNMLRRRNQTFYGGFIPCQLCTAGENGLKSCIFFCRNIRGRHPRINRWSQHFPSLCHLSFHLDIYRPPNKICEEPWLKNQFWTVHTCTWDWVQ